MISSRFEWTRALHRSAFYRNTAYGAFIEFTIKCHENRINNLVGATFSLRLFRRRPSITQKPTGFQFSMGFVLVVIQMALRITINPNKFLLFWILSWFFSLGRAFVLVLVGVVVVVGDSNRAAHIIFNSQPSSFALFKRFHVRIHDVRWIWCFKLKIMACRMSDRDRVTTSRTLTR